MMDALEFLREHKRMCNRYDGCCDCPLEVSICPGSSTMPDEDYKKLITVVEHWSAAHPHKTRQSVFLEQWPNARPADDGVLTFCPKRFDFHISCLAECHSLKKCSDCRREFWMQEAE